jgi:hypothetical protein
LPYWGGYLPNNTRKALLGGDAGPFAYGVPKYIHNDDRLVFSAHLEVDNIPLDINANPLKFIAKVCFRTSAPSFKISDLKIIWRLHRIAWTGKASAQWLQQQLADHNCEEHGCKLFATVFDMTHVNAGEILQQKRAQQQIGRI